MALMHVQMSYIDGTNKEADMYPDEFGNLMNIIMKMSRKAVDAPVMLSITRKDIIPRQQMLIEQEKTDEENR